MTDDASDSMHWALCVSVSYLNEPGSELPTKLDGILARSNVISTLFTKTNHNVFVMMPIHAV